MPSKPESHGLSVAPAPASASGANLREPRGVKSKPVDLSTQRILQVFSRYVDHGGEELSVGRIAEQLGAVSSLTSLIYENSDWKRSDAPSLLGQALRTVYNWESAREFRDTVRATDATLAVFHNLYPIASPSLYRAALSTEIPVIQFLHNYRPFSINATWFNDGAVTGDTLKLSVWEEARKAAWQQSRVKSAVMAAALSQLHRSGWLSSVKAWVAISDFVRDRFIEAGVPAEDIFTVRHFWHPRPASNDASDDRYYLMLARLVPEKGIDVAIKAWNLLAKRGEPGTPRLVIAGSGPMESAIRNAARENPAIEFAGFAEGEMKADLLRNCRALVAPMIWWEPLGLVFYEAYDYGKPVLAAASGGIPEIVNDGVTGLIHRPGQAEELAGHVERMEAMSAASRRAMGGEGRAWLLANTAPEKWLEEFRSVAGYALRS